MGFDVLLDKRRRVRLGGWAIRLGPLGSFHLGGGWYTVGRLSFMRWMQLITALGAGSEPEINIMAVQKMAALAPLLTVEPLRSKHARRISQDQAVDLWAKLGETNDLSYLFTAMAKLAAGATGEGDLTLFDEIHSFCMQCPMYQHDQVKNLPAQVYYSIWDSIENHRTRSEETPDPGHKGIKAPTFDHVPTLDEINAAMAQVNDG